MFVVLRAREQSDEHTEYVQDMVRTLMAPSTCH